MRAAGGQSGSYSWSGELMRIAWQFTRSRPMRALHQKKKEKQNLEGGQSMSGICQISNPL